MNIEMITTHCPHCHTQYKITPGHLKIASGKVRCGKCLSVFDALPETPKWSDTMETTDVGHSAHIDTHSTDAQKAAYSGTESSDNISLFAQTKDFDDASNSIKLANDLHSSNQPSNLKSIEQPLSKLASQLRQLNTAQIDTEALQSKPYLNITAEPLSLRNPDFKQPKRNDLPIMLACFLGIMILAFQVLWFERQSLAKYPALDTAYQAICVLMSCDLPSHKAYQEIVSHQLIIRQHPRHPDGLIASLVIENTASFYQPFPILRLSFTDQKNTQVAVRAFTPQEYLNSPLFDSQRMPTKQRLEVGLEMMKPIEGQLGYNLSILPAH
ncbi:hypothetical protein DN062_10470 [Nitrincola tibetensis]|uniref:Zinc finger/thioredoxin putative domain-containing protein n=1 Tax=Nitrincola tibetensis TaxID=2219697 RepID=A0A364NLB6_9GAMM|nr:DUF3426 domain-containing protein [Nitrincola tibetensis]RAU17790.1 hypothetical protein DN062_10470 [Nitrincola tibetensis]